MRRNQKRVLYQASRIDRLQRCIFLQLYSIKAYQMKESPNFDLHQLIQSLVNLPQPYTEITILTLTPQLLEFKVQKPAKSKHKKYKIVCTADQILIQAKVLASGMTKFAVCKLAFNRNLYETVQHNLSKLYLQLLEVFGSISFNEILIDGPARNLSQVFDQIITNFRVLKLNFLFPLSLKIIAKFVSQLHERLLSLNVIICFEIAENNQKQIVLFAQNWINSLPFQKEYQQHSVEMKFGYPFPLVQRRRNRVGRKEQISLLFKARQILTARQLQEQGRFFILTEEYSVTFVKQVIRLLFSTQKGVHFEIPSFQSSKLMQLAQYVAYNFRKGYRFNIGHQLQLSNNRMILNTHDLNTDETHRLMKIGCKSGMYEIVMYSEVKYFQLAVDLFLKKPFIKFNFFMPLEELTPVISVLIKKIEDQCSIMRANAYSFAGILKHYGQRGYVVVNSVFNALAEQTD